MSERAMAPVETVAVQAGPLSAVAPLLLEVLVLVPLEPELELELVLVLLVAPDEEPDVAPELLVVPPVLVPPPVELAGSLPEDAPPPEL